MIRPEAAAALTRWREALIGGGLALLGLYWITARSFGLLHYLGYVVAVVGAALLVAGVQRARFRQGGGGAGIVTVSEGRIAYFGPLTGGVADLGDITRLGLDPRLKPAHWIIDQPTQPALLIPLNAEGADALFDAFSALPGLRTEHMLRQIETPPDHPVVIWQRPDVQNATRRLH